MKGKLRIVAAAASVCALVIVTALATSSLAGAGATTVHVIEHATTDVVIDTGAAGDTSGDLLTFANDVYNANDTAVVGHDQGDCVRIDPAAGSWECRWVTILDNGSITVEGPFYDTTNSVLAITGGTGAYKGARGQMRLKSRDGGAKYDFIFRIIG
ncbi:MAG TPA: allene oxide cyclase family protein [Actinomycetota bacterium]